MSNTYQLTRIEKIYPKREDAVSKLSSLSLSFGTIVAIRYFAKVEDSKCECGCAPGFDDNIRMLLAGYLSEEPGSFFIFGDSDNNIEDWADGTGVNVYQGIMSENQSYEEAIAATLFGITPQQKDIVVLSNKALGINSTYMYLGKKWVCIGKELPEYKFDSTQFNYEPVERKVSIKSIYGGTF